MPPVAREAVDEHSERVVYDGRCDEHQQKIRMFVCTGGVKDHASYAYRGVAPTLGKLIIYAEKQGNEKKYKFKTAEIHGLLLLMMCAPSYHADGIYIGKRQKNSKNRLNFAPRVIDKRKKTCYNNKVVGNDVNAGMAELADALDSGSSEGSLMKVQVLLPAPNNQTGLCPQGIATFDYLTK